MAISGPLEGQLIELTEAETTLGRDAGTRIQLEDDLVSRRHCEISKSNDDFVIRDLDSRNQTFVNGVPVREHALQHGDRIQAGYSLLFFFVNEDEEIPSGAAGLETVQDSDMENTRSVTHLSVEDSRYLKPAKAADSVSSELLGTRDDRTVRGLEILLDISRDVAVVRSLGDLQERLLASLFEAFPAERAAILLDPVGDPEAAEFSSVFMRRRDGKNGSKFSVSHTILGKVLSTRQAVLSNDIPQDAELASVDSLKLGRVHSLLCAPIRYQSDLRGVLYLDTTRPADAFDDDDLELLAGVAGIIGAPLENARIKERLREENDRFLDEALLHGIVGNSASVRALLERIAKCAASDRSVLIQGGSGTGKELVARAIRRSGKRAEKPFVAINCAALVDTLVETELFGTVKGAFTGAVDRIGKLQYANGGTVFLDEIGEMKPELQAKLLRVLDEQRFERVGGHHPITVDVRIIAATNIDVKKAMEEGRFREDLYFRLSVLTLKVPALRDRREDIGILANHFLKEASKDCSRQILGISQDARACLAHYDWPGNIRQLKHAIEHAVDMGSADVIMPEDLPVAIAQGGTGDGASPQGLQQRLREAEKQIVMDAIRSANGSITEAARLLGIHPNNLHRVIGRLDLRAAVDEFKRGASA